MSIRHSPLDNHLRERSQANPMVALRKVKCNFAEGERVLCYEPDPSKAKVLYDSKILRCLIHREEAAGPKQRRPSIDYLVHFYGWNSSWDRRVREENILKDTADNRKLQRTLAEEAACQLKGKKVKLNKIPAVIRQVVVGTINNDLLNDDHNAKDGYEASLNPNHLHSPTMLKTTPSLSPIEDLTSHDSRSPFASNSCSTNQSDIEFASVNQLLMGNHPQFTSTNTTTSSNSVDTIEKSEICQRILSSLDGRLKSILERDQQTVALHGQLHSLPVDQQISVRQILRDFEQNQIARTNSDSDPPSLNITPNTTTVFSTPTTTVVTITCPPLSSAECVFPCIQTLSEFCNSIEIYFNTLTTRSYLFYCDQEKEQLARCNASSTTPTGTNQCPAETYGFVHLLRLVVILPDFLCVCQMPKKRMKHLVDYVCHFSQFLAKHADRYLPETY